MKKVLKIFSTGILLIFLIYLLLPTPSFPVQPPDSMQSIEGADVETPLRRAYFTNYTRAQVLEHYQIQLERSLFFGIPIPTYRLNYPPEDAFRLIRDQTRSVFLEEIVHPFRESLFVNGFVAREEKDDIWYRGVHYSQKITVKYSPAVAVVRITVFFIGVSILLFLIRELFNSTKYLLKIWRGREQ